MATALAVGAMGYAIATLIQGAMAKRPCRLAQDLAGDAFRIGVAAPMTFDPDHREDQSMPTETTRT